jgi:hypothetical protein
MRPVDSVTSPDTQDPFKRISIAWTISSSSWNHLELRSTNAVKPMHCPHKVLQFCLGVATINCCNPVQVARCSVWLGHIVITTNDLSSCISATTFNIAISIILSICRLKIHLQTWCPFQIFKVQYVCSMDLYYRWRLETLERRSLKKCWHTSPATRFCCKEFETVNTRYVNTVCPFTVYAA